MKKWIMKLNKNVEYKTGWLEKSQTSNVCQLTKASLNVVLANLYSSGMKL